MNVLQRYPLTVYVADNGGVDVIQPNEHWRLLNDEGYVSTIVCKAADVGFTVINQRLEPGEPWVGYVIRWPEHGLPTAIQGEVAYNDADECWVFVDLIEQLETALTAIELFD